MHDETGPSARAADWRTPAVMLICGSVILAVSMGIRHGFGLFMKPMSFDLGYSRELFAFALALQNLVWGATQPLVGAYSDARGAGRTLGLGALLYAAGLAAMAFVHTPWLFVLASASLIGLALSCCTFSVVCGVVGRAYPPEKRSLALGIAGAASSFGQFAFLPFSESLITALGWLPTLLVLAGVSLAVLPLALGLVERRAAPKGGVASAGRVSARAALGDALAVRDFWLLCFGYFVCGFQVIFIAIHLPVYLQDAGLPAAVGARALALIGLFNIFGSYFAGWLGARVRKPLLLGGIYGLRAVVIALYLLGPLSASTTYLFAAAIGFLWLSTVPLTNGTVATMFGVTHLAMLSGVVFFFHQLGAFAGGWAGGYLYDRFGSYDAVWYGAIALGLLALVVNMPIAERAQGRLVVRAA
ncbi:MAG: MFS transporter [Rhodocyclaceae bacterium]|nr:MFS transporter [Rhodocyclaceae bacterium]